MTYIADDKGYRVVGDAKIESAPRPTTARPTPAPTAAPTRAPVVAKAPAPVATVAAIQVIPVSFAHVVPVQAHFGGFYHSGFAGNCGGDGQEVFGADGARYVLKKIA